ncbi:hypothetical protein BH23ACT12_BH23ACT12_12630 [soil metagenome]
MQEPATEISPPGSPNLFGKRMAPDSPKRPLAEVALMGGGALLITSSVIQLLLWSQSYRDIEPIGPLLVLLGIVGIILALVVVRFGNLGLALAGAIYLTATTVLLLLVTTLELLGYQDGLATPFSGGSIIVPLMGVVLLAGTAWLISPPQRKPRRVRSPKSAAAADGPKTEEQALQATTLIPGANFDGVERIRWPAERPHMQLATAPQAPVEETPTEEEPVAEPEASSEPEAAESQVIPEPATVEVEAEPVMEQEPVMQESTEELAAVPEVVPDSIPEPMRSMLIREQEILERLSRALGPDDPGTLTIRGNIAAYYLSAGDVNRAAELQEAVAADSARILGDAHPHTLTAQGKAVQWRKLAKKRRKPKAPAPG